MATTIEYGTYIIDLCNAMLEHPGGLTQAQGKRLKVIRRQTINFLTKYMSHQSSSLLDLLTYFNEYALKPLQIIHACCESILNGQCGPVQPDYGEAIVEIVDCCLAMHDDIDDMRKNLDQLMNDLDMV
ncbi:MAG: hypothetical protein ACFE0Q_05420 [Anaerolineae bacterium]